MTTSTPELRRVWSAVTACAVFMAACSPSLHVGMYPESDRDLLDEVELLLDVSIVEDSGSRGVVRIGALSICDPRADGLDLDHKGCDRSVVADWLNPLATAHELGHQLRLSHVSNPDSFMHSCGAPGPEGVTVQQRDDMDSELRYLARCR